MQLAARIARQGFATLVAALAVATVAVLFVIPRLTDGAALTVLSGSMTPTYPVGSVVVVRPIDPANVRAGDVITYAERRGSFTTHRVVDVNTDADGQLSFTTQGDANRGPDADPVLADDVRGRVWFHVNHLGYLREAVSSPTGFAAIVALVTLTLVWDRASSYIRRRVRRPAWLSDRIIGSPPTAATSAAAPDMPHMELDPNPSSTAVASPPDAGPIEDSAGLLEPIPVSGVSVDLQPLARVEQQFLLARLNAGVFERGNVLEILELVRGQVVAFGPRHMVVSVSGTTEHLDGVERLLRPFGLVEARRSHVVHIGGEPTPDTDVHGPSEAVTSAVDDLSALVLGPARPPRVSFTCAPANGRSKERSDQ